uniref:Putative secreted protein n=1 Tax=Ixodes ricinus TaxID=34613 RepID=A0A6B0UN62_IXORI
MCGLRSYYPMLLFFVSLPQCSLNRMFTQAPPERVSPLKGCCSLKRPSPRSNHRNCSAYIQKRKRASLAQRNEENRTEMGGGHKAGFHQENLANKRGTQTPREKEPNEAELCRRKVLLSW